MPSDHVSSRHRSRDAGRNGVEDREAGSSSSSRKSIDPHRSRHKDDIDDSASSRHRHRHRHHRHHHHSGLNGDEDRRRSHRSRSRSRSPRRTRDHHDSSRNRSHRHHNDDKDTERRRQRTDGDSTASRVHDDDEENGRQLTRSEREAWTEQVQADHMEDAVAAIPSTEQLQMTSHAAPSRSDQQTAGPLRRDDWMVSGDLGGTQGKSTAASSSEAAGADDFFAGMATYSRQRPPKPEKRNPDELHVSSRELNRQFAEGKHLDEYDEPMANKQVAAPVHGGAGSQWRMMKLRRTYEAAEEDGRNLEEVALERYASLDAFNEARAERQFLDDRQGRRDQGGAASRTDTPKGSAPPSRPLSRQSSSFRRPGEGSAPSTPGGPHASARRPATGLRPSGLNDALDRSKTSTPIPSVFTPPIHQSRPAALGSSEKEHADEGNGTDAVVDAVAASNAREAATEPPMSAAALNKLSAKVLRAEMMGSVDAAALRHQLELEQARRDGGGDRGLVGDAVGALQDGETTVQVLPTLDARGRLYDVGNSSTAEQAESQPGKRRKADKFETRDSKTGELLRYNADDDEQTIGDLVREERFGAGSASQKSMDAQMADRIMNDKAFKDTVDYMDDNVERLGRRKMKSDAMKRMFAVQDFAKTKKALDTCAFCWQDDEPPRTTVVSSGTRSYLALPDTEALVPGHCIVVPMQHHLSMLEADEDTWEEVKNFMKCLIQMAALREERVLFYETVRTLKHQRHTCIEAVPLEQGLFSQLPGYFRQSILEAGDEWSQNRRLIEFSAKRPFRQSMVPNLPYFMVQWDHRGEKGYGHVIEESTGGGVADFDGAADDGLDERAGGGGGAFPHWFASEIIGNLLEYEPRRWRKPRRLQREEQVRALQAFRTPWTPFDWTRMLNPDDDSSSSNQASGSKPLT